MELHVFVIALQLRSQNLNIDTIRNLSVKSSQYDFRISQKTVNPGLAL